MINEQCITQGGLAAEIVVRAEPTPHPLPSMTWQQGTAPRLLVHLDNDGSRAYPYPSEAIDCRLIYGQSPSADAVVSVCGRAETQLCWSFAIPAIAWNSVDPSTGHISPWWYGIYFDELDEEGNVLRRNWLGDGRLTIIPSSLAETVPVMSPGTAYGNVLTAGDGSKWRLIVEVVDGNPHLKLLPFSDV